MKNSTNSRIDFSLIITAHSEGLLLLPTLRAASIGVNKLLESNISAEILIILDNATQQTIDVAKHWRNSISEFQVNLEYTNHGESGAARNAGCQLASGLVIGFCDGDDLFSDSYLISGYFAAIGNEESTFFHPGKVLSFGEFPSLWEVKGFSNDEMSFKDLIEANLWPSSSIGLRETYLQNPFLSLAPKSGFGPEDWAWNIETTIRGIHHEVLGNAVFCYRTRASSGVNSQHKYSVLPYFDIVALEKAFPRPSSGSASVASLNYRDKFMKLPGRI